MGPFRKGRAAFSHAVQPRMDSAPKTIRLFKPGETVEVSGIYAQLDAEGLIRGHATCVRGEPFPPTAHEGLSWALVQASSEPDA